MRKQKAMIALLRGLTDLLAEESARNPDFAARVEALLSEVPAERSRPTKPSVAKTQHNLPDIHAELNARGDHEFRLWLRDQPVTTLRALIRAQDLDSTRRTARWKDAAKLADFIADGLHARLSRGGAFLNRS